MLRGARIAPVVVAVVCGLAFAAAAPAATLVGDYQMQGTRASSGPGPDLTDVGTGANAFQNDTVMGSSRQVLAFPLGNGVRMSPAGLNGDSATSVVTTFRFDAVNEYRKILDYSGGVSDDGIYDKDGLASFFGTTEFVSSNPVFSPGTYATIAITTKPIATTKVYVNGTQVIGADETLLTALDSLRFFVDDGTTGDEDSAGAVSCIRVFAGTLTDGEVGAIGASANCQPPSVPPAHSQATKKKCKKHKKHKRSAESAKKKCKKKKKR